MIEISDFRLTKLSQALISEGVARTPMMIKLHYIELWIQSNKAKGGPSYLLFMAGDLLSLSTRVHHASKNISCDRTRHLLKSCSIPNNNLEHGNSITWNMETQVAVFGDSITACSSLMVISCSCNHLPIWRINCTVYCAIEPWQAHQCSRCLPQTHF